MSFPRNQRFLRLDLPQKPFGTRVKRENNVLSALQLELGWDRLMRFLMSRLTYFFSHRSRGNRVLIVGAEG